MKIVGLINKEEKAEIIWIAKLAIVERRIQYLAQEAKQDVLLA